MRFPRKVSCTDFDEKCCLYVHDKVVTYTVNVFLNDGRFLLISPYYIDRVKKLVISHLIKKIIEKITDIPCYVLSYLSFISLFC